MAEIPSSAIKARDMLKRAGLVGIVGSLAPIAAELQVDGSRRGAVIWNHATRSRMEAATRAVLEAARTIAGKSDELPRPARWRCTIERMGTAGLAGRLEWVRWPDDTETPDPEAGARVAVRALAEVAGLERRDVRFEAVGRGRPAAGRR